MDMNNNGIIRLVLNIYSICIRKFFITKVIEIILFSKVIEGYQANNLRKYYVYYNKIKVIEGYQYHIEDLSVLYWLMDENSNGQLLLVDRNIEYPPQNGYLIIIRFKYSNSITTSKMGFTWCPRCAGCSRLNIDIAKEIALKKGSTCLSEEYRNSYTPLLWQSQSKNGECLSDKYINNHIPLQWRCHQKHIWYASLGHQRYANLKCVRNFNTWCPYCSGRYSCNLELAKKVANEKGGDCISEKYINSITPLLWQCKNHLWYANLDKVKNSDTWCPFCPWKREELCKNVVTKLLGSPFDIRRPDFLKTPGHLLGLELDIYYPQYGFAIEVQGIQHECFHAFFHKEQFARDQLKKELCDENWIVLIEVWYYEDPHTVIPQQLRELGFIP
ncbi:hypothetical protein Glove_283g91 [Diversispora epigaea]|uniref:Zinc-ribbon domain-containing protein n=1 Tax=Diversispora epigaea TaxID=1348612 RepID=A0A397I1L8_9GLOM|nr:hypothetical protein Glove_283g91 [Diversispora epigaea]